MAVISIISPSVILVTIATLPIVSAVVILTGLLMRKWQMERLLADFPSLPGRHWLFGHLHMTTADEKAIAWFQKHVDDGVYASVVWVGPFIPVLSTFHPDTVKVLLKSSEPKSEDFYRFLRPWIGDGLLVSSGKKWARNRRLLTPGFHFNILKPYLDIFQESAGVLVEKWRSACKDAEMKSMEMFSCISLMMLDSLLKCIFSAETNCQTVEDHPYIKGIYEIATLLEQRGHFLPFYVDAIFNWSPSGRRFHRAVQSVHNYARDIIMKRKKILEDQAASGKTQNGKYVDFLDILLCAKDVDGKGLTDQEIYDEVDTFMFEGHDTTTSGISWFLYNMARFPDFQEKCRQEIDKLFADRESDKLEWDDLHNLPYLTQCLKESLRFHPPVMSIMRTLTQPLTFSDGRTAPKGVSMSVLIHGLHHNKAVWDDPETFDPERFSAEKSKFIPPYAYVPFSAGPRNCIGQHFAMNEMKVVAVMVLRNFVLSIDKAKSTDRYIALVLRAQTGINLYIKPRKFENH